MSVRPDSGMRGRFDPVNTDEQRVTHTRHVVETWVMLRRLLWAMIAIACLSACGSSSDAHNDPGDPAVWYVGADENLRPNTTDFMVMVTRTGCSSGVQGKPQKPVIDAGASAITITFKIDPHISGGNCQGTAGVDYRVRLSEPIGERTLVDGSCDSVSGLASTAFCSKAGVRVLWRHGQLHPVS
jgi:hypothetical protein